MAGIDAEYVFEVGDLRVWAGDMERDVDPDVAGLVERSAVCRPRGRLWPHGSYDG